MASSAPTGVIASAADPVAASAVGTCLLAQPGGRLLPRQADRPSDVGRRMKVIVSRPAHEIKPTRSGECHDLARKPPRRTRAGPLRVDVERGRRHARNCRHDVVGRVVDCDRRGSASDLGARAGRRLGSAIEGKGTTSQRAHHEPGPAEGASDRDPRRAAPAARGEP